MNYFDFTITLTCQILRDIILATHCRHCKCYIDRWNFRDRKNIGFEMMMGTWMTGIWRYVQRYSWPYVAPRISDRFFKPFSRVKCNITVISLLLGKYTRMFVPRFPTALRNITFRGFPGTSGKTFWYISQEAMNYLHNIVTDTRKG